MPSNRIRKTRNKSHLDPAHRILPAPDPSGEPVKHVLVFQSTPPYGGRLVNLAVVLAGICFNPRPRAGGDTVLLFYVLRTMSFNPRPRAGGDIYSRGLRSSGACFNPRPRAGGDDRVAEEIVAFESVSIHAPVRGATRRRGFSPRRFIQFQSTPPCGGRRHKAGQTSGKKVFQSTPPCGGRPWPFSPLRILSRFNPRPRAGGDIDHLPRIFYQGVSIHAPVRGATF